MDWLRTIAPTIATALVGPLGGAAVAAIGEAIGLSEPTRDKIERVLTSGNMTGEQLAAIQQAEIAFKTRMTELGVDLERIASADRDSARSMQVKTGSIAPGLLATIVVLTWGLVQYFLLSHVIDQTMRELVARLLGTLDAALLLVLQFYFGSSRSSQAKDQVIANIAK